jgi:co-chaperonin GroES (HSP10)
MEEVVNAGKFKPYNDRVLIRRLMPAEQTKGGLWIPPSVQESMQTVHGLEGEVLSCGPNCKDVKPGDVVFFGQYSFTELPKQKKKEFIIVREADILCVRELEATAA